jgi:hypothetical protein
MFKVVTMVFQQIMTEFNEAKSEQDTTVAITKVVLKLMNQMALNDKPVLSSEGAPHINKTATV